MKILIDSYNTVKQNKSGGIQIRIEKYIKNLSKYHEVKLFDKWNDNIKDFDILHIFKLNIEDYEIMKLAKDNNIPVVISSIVPSTNRFKILFNRILCKILPIHTGYWFLNKMLLDADTIIAQTKKEAKFISKYYKVSIEKINVIPNGVNLKINKKDKNIFSDLTNIKEKFVLQVGRFDENKNQLNVIKAMSGLDIPLILIGGPDKSSPQYYELCKKHAGENVHFLGWIDHENPLLSSAYQNAHVVILPSYKEIFGNSLIEGGAAGANLIATRELPISDWEIGEICQSINPNDINDIRKKIVSAINKPLNPNTSNIITEKFSWESVINQHITIYNNILKRGEK